ncbi:hypothetical protein A6A08_05190 [Nocardiopsis sp. TSRI0078]|uniref:hypothetical protein n=1 Tax=unclassified Nocardiopsis TaxID=2649073 RepID=UPI00095E7A76|nr:hypothetical protein [Nocardiopsis sp. TSRI0078]OKI18999.1 hypothetical protein A6A08_05190 [Nocardiopsis sp. TSRI0078]
MPDGPSPEEAAPAGEASPAEEAASGFVRPEEPYAGMDAELSERLHLPVYDHRLDEYEGYVVSRAVDTLVVECLADLGYEASVNADTRMDPLTMRGFGPQREYRRYGSTRIDIAEEHAFGLPGGDGGDPAYRIGGDADLRAGAEAAVSGQVEDVRTPSGEPLPEGGCLTWARRQIEPGSPMPFETGEDGTPADVPSSHMLVEDLLGESFLAAMEDPRVTAAAAAWQECMAERVDGYHGTPTSGEGAAPEAAVPSVECKDSSGYLDAFVGAERDVLDGLVAEHEEALTARHDRLRKNLGASLEILGW